MTENCIRQTHEQQAENFSENHRNRGFHFYSSFRVVSVRRLCPAGEGGYDLLDSEEQAS
jgi:hypothetical protein